MRTLFVSTHTDQITGYSKVAYNLLSRMRGDIYHFGFQRNEKYRRPKLDHIKQYDAQANEDPKEQGFGFNVFTQYVELVNPDIIVIYNDTIVVNKFISLIPDYKGKLVVYLDQVYKHTQLGNISKADKLFVFSESWKVETDIPQIVLPHAPTTAVVSQTLVDSFKEKYDLNGKELFLNINRNSSRKRLDLTLQAFKRYVVSNPEAVLLLVTSSVGYYDISAIVSLEGFPTKNIRFIDTKNGDITDHLINLLYNVCDYGMNTADGEGFGLSTLEHASLGKPQLVLDIGAYRDFLTAECNVLLKPTIRNYIHNDGVGLYNETTTVEHVVEGLDRLKQCKIPVVTLTWDEIVNTLTQNLVNLNLPQ